MIFCVSSAEYSGGWTVDRRALSRDQGALLFTLNSNSRRQLHKVDRLVC
eukprot:SAG11_NODE_7529_length_1134_cov_1.291787_2_plen_49_part_00